MSLPSFIDDDFLLESSTARDLYHGFAEHLPIIDYHTHLPPQQIAQNHGFRTLSELWLEGDHYKWRAMRANGVPERYCTGGASAWEKFEAWAKTVPHTVRNPLYHWTHMELANPFGIRELLDESSAQAIYACASERLEEETFHARGLLRHFGVVVVCTTDDPTDTLEHHARYAARFRQGLRLYPTWRPDNALAVEDLDRYNLWLDRLEQAADASIVTFDSLLEALRKRHACFHEHGCRVSDHGLETIYAEPCTTEEARAVFEKARARKALSELEIVKFKSALLYEFGVMDHARGWVQQFHLGALRNNNSRMARELGPDTGFDSIGDFSIARPLARFLDRLDQTDQLAPTILYNSNPADNEVMATMLGNFQDGSTPGKMQHGSAWWFLDQKDGIEKQIGALSNMGLLSRFVGMLTDSRSFLSYSRHEYFRRVLCNILGDDVRRGLVPNDLALLGRLVENICFYNAKNYFKFETPDSDVRIDRAASSVTNGVLP